ncbi:MULTISPECIES: glutamate synthase large subunit [unclassified Saccharibacter]|uniref:glutamate synthase large subunit n=1 Tax=unclassified Saccharibacter TaxID=2648722 RepID=UPI0013216D09|nr:MULTISPECIES: glutamate synthase large subunit [unclassified Saccharibacter]MXV36173.1 glutamate synthase large subunit [Saccharibacter sp. EH611]MXV57032.1 glutamate synthase large subunit [Saccharibacter sp. EH70]MXV66608.1 glutamate synthase large subunit [Saccharibacter sp. EH60]
MSDRTFVREYQDNVERLSDVYDPQQEHDACGVGVVAALDGAPKRSVVKAGIEALGNLWHRGAVDADGKTGDGAGIHIEIPQNFFAEAIYSGGDVVVEGRIAVGMVFLPRTDLGAQESGRQIIETEILKFGYGIYGWRQVPIDTSYIGEKANETRPEIEQIMIRNTLGRDDETFERDLYVIRRRIEKAAASAHVDVYICSLSCRSVIYKGMFLAENLTDFYPDLLDERFVSRFAIYHQRYSTNTFPTWKLAQPFRKIAHNGEINTLSGNVNWMRAHETRLSHPDLDPYMDALKPVVQVAGSDTAALDNIFELLTFAGRDATAAKALLVPASAGANSSMSPKVKAFFRYCNAVIEPWDGPAALCGTDGRWVIAGLDRAGLRPLRYSITKDGLLIVGSETGMVRVPDDAVLQRGRLGPGQTLALDLEKGQLYAPDEVMELLASRQDFERWVDQIQDISPLLADVHEKGALAVEELRRRQLAVSLTYEEMETILQPMVANAAEAIGSMGDDTPLQVLSGHYRGLAHYFRQGFSQVTNPPIDSLRETRVMSLITRMGNLGNILEEASSQCRLLQLSSPILTNGEFDKLRQVCDTQGAVIDCTFPIEWGENGLRRALTEMSRQAEDAVRGGCSHLFLTDEHSGAERVAVPMILATAAVHRHLINQSLRTFTSVNVRTSETLDVHGIAVTIGVGASTVNPWLAQHGIADRVRRGLLGSMTLGEAMQRYRTAVDKGLLKIMSKAGISLVASYRGGYNFEAVGLSRALVSEFFPGMASRISGIGLSGIARHVLHAHKKAWGQEGVVTLPVGGRYKIRPKGEVHSLSATVVHLLQTAVTANSSKLYRRYSEALRAQPPIALRDLLDFRTSARSIDVDDVEGITQIRHRLVAPGISLGALSPEAHETLAIAMNRIGAKSDSGEGGEDPSRAYPRPNGDNASSAIKQVASGRFGVTAEYLNDCREIEIKVAQGAKPGEGGQLPGFKVTELIARLRHATPGVTLISPPPHHDIYSIEDLAQLIYDLKQINPDATVTVKLVARTGIGTIAAGVAKAKADAILISGHSGGTGASSQSSIHHAGLPWEMGLSEAHQVLMLNRLRHRLVLRVDGGIKSGRDVVIAAMLGAEEFGIGTAALVAMGCIMVRQCHSNTCPVGVCVQDEDLRKKFEGSPEKVINLFTLIAEEVRTILAGLGVRSLTDVIGRTDMLHQVYRGAEYLDDLDLNSLLVQADAGGYARYCTREGRNAVPDTLDAQIINDARPLFERREKLHLQYDVRNTHRAVGTRISSLITRKFGMNSLPEGHLTLSLRGSAGQSLGAFAVHGLRIDVEGDANDYVGKGLSGATLVLRPSQAAHWESSENSIVGNTVLYGATAGALFAAGQAGERFAVRNSGAVAVVEGCGSNGCEYMTGGTVVVLGKVGDNFGAGFTGGTAYVLDIDGGFASRVNGDTLTWKRVTVPRWADELRSLVERHVTETGSAYAASLLHAWEDILPQFWHVVPQDYARIIGYEDEDLSSLSA